MTCDDAAVPAADSSHPYRSESNASASCNPLQLTVQTYGTTPLTGPGRLWHSVRADLWWLLLFNISWINHGPLINDSFQWICHCSCWNLCRRLVVAAEPSLLVGSCSCERQQLAQPVITVTPMGPCKRVGEEEARAYHTSDSAHTAEARFHFYLAPVTLVLFVRPSVRNCWRGLHNI